jgi:hypothetical protein
MKIRGNTDLLFSEWDHIPLDGKRLHMLCKTPIRIEDI